MPSSHTICVPTNVLRWTGSGLSIPHFSHQGVYYCALDKLEIYPPSEDPKVCVFTGVSFLGVVERLLVIWLSTMPFLYLPTLWED